MPVRRKSLLPLLLIPAFHSPLEAQEQPATRAETFVAADIRVEGLQRIAVGTVLTYLPIERGDLVTSSKNPVLYRERKDSASPEDVTRSPRSMGRYVRTVPIAMR